MTRFVGAIRAGIDAFRRAYLATSTDPSYAAGRAGYGFGDHAARAARYAAFWAAYENTLYDDPPAGRGPGGAAASAFKREMGLYPYTRGVLNPAFRLVEFHVAHVLGGDLDPGAGDGSSVTTALPILDASDAMRVALAKLWLDSNFATVKDLLARRGAAVGDAFLTAVDTVDRVYLKTVPAEQVVEIEKDSRGNVKRYAIERYRDDPNAPPRTILDLGGPRPPQVLYTETAERDGEDVVYRTYLDRRPFAWDGQPREWAVPYGFVPFWHVEHIASGTGWGWPEMFAGLPKICEIDEQASKAGDAIRKLVETTWVLAGVSPTEAEAAMAGFRADGSKARNQSLTIYAKDPAATPRPMVAALDIAGVTDYTRYLCEQFYQDYPELRYELIRASGDANAKALREARKPAEAKVKQRRVQYDAALIKAFQGAVAIGGWRQSRSPGVADLAPYAGFDLTSYGRGDLDLSIGPRPVFDTTDADEAESDTVVAASVQAWVNAGVPLDLALRRAGWSDEDIAAVAADQDRRAAESDARLARMAETVPGVGQ